MAYGKRRRKRGFVKKGRRPGRRRSSQKRLGTYKMARGGIRL